MLRLVILNNNLFRMRNVYGNVPFILNIISFDSRSVYIYIESIAIHRSAKQTVQDKMYIGENSSCFEARSVTYSSYLVLLIALFKNKVKR